MLTILIFGLVFVHNNLSRKDPRDYKCHVENASEISGSIRSLNIFLQAPGIAATKGKLSRIQKVITLECFSLQSPVQVHLLYLEKMHGDLANQTLEKRTLQSLKVVTSADRKPAISHTCVLLTRHRKKFQRKFILREKVFLAGISNCVITAKLPKLKVFAEGLTVPHVHQENQTSEKGIPSINDKDMLNRQKLSIVIKVFIACILLAFALPCIVFVIYEIPCLDALGGSHLRGLRERRLQGKNTLFGHTGWGKAYATGF
ncbi:PREDICTED: uncharacterized protein C17orf78 homolog [Aptenodytes forsteri]|uniref:uncharacterized protein C17orf78 homolog n=1 Tax=Aptenodytes forsteri TaxID=9233 RepID=UPI0009059D96|nr:PREDICTED: uncharacterized protein C17orf78 homolog [Aptenodytes forsteri]